MSKTILQSLLSTHPQLIPITNALVEHGARVLLVGGAVRDALLGVPIKDIDIEVHGISLNTLRSVLRQFGRIDEVGKSFGVLRLRTLDADWSMPRRDSIGRKPEVTVDPGMSLEDAFKRRDVTINAMGIDLKSGELIDPYGGQKDLNHKTLRAVDPEFFVHDPLRLFRVMSFIGRFNLQPNQALDDICRTMDISGVSSERTWEEIKKLLLRSDNPSLGIDWLRKIGRLKEVMPELYATIGVEQDPHWHPEGDVYTHTLQALDVAAQQEYDTEQQKLRCMLAVLCHDLGKVSTTTRNEEGRIISYGHAQASAPLAKQLLKRWTNNAKLIQAVSKLVYVHMDPVGFIKSDAGPGAYKRLARKLAPDTSIADLTHVVTADKLGRRAAGTALPTQLPEEIQEFIHKATELDVLHRPIEPLLKGADFLDIVAPGPKLGKLVEYAYDVQLKQGITDKQELKNLVIQAKIIPK